MHTSLLLHDKRYILWGVGWHLKRDDVLDVFCIEGILVSSNGSCTLCGLAWLEASIALKQTNNRSIRKIDNYTSCQSVFERTLIFSSVLGFRSTNRQLYGVDVESRYASIKKLDLPGYICVAR